jgi:hypothetical protein
MSNYRGITTWQEFHGRLRHLQETSRALANGEHDERALYMQAKALDAFVECQRRLWEEERALNVEHYVKGTR